MMYCEAITYSGIKDIIEHCKELCYLKLEGMDGLTITEPDMNIIYEQLLKTGNLKFPRAQEPKITSTWTKTINTRRAP
jgi:hypothetical protein